MLLHCVRVEQQKWLLFFTKNSSFNRTEYELSSLYLRPLSASNLLQSSGIQGEIAYEDITVIHARNFLLIKKFSTAEI